MIPGPLRSEAVDRSQLRRVADRWAPTGSRARVVLGAGAASAREIRKLVGHLRTEATDSAIRLGLEWTDERWSRANAPTDADLRRQRALAASSPHSIVVRVVISGTDPVQRAATLASLDAQTWSHWGVIDLETLAGSSEPASAPGDPVVFVVAGDRFDPDAMFRIADAFWTDPSLDAVTWDDDAPGDDGVVAPRLRPSWSPELLLSADYVGRAVAVRAGAIQRVGAPSRVGGDELWALLLRLGLAEDRVGRIPRVLSHLAGRDEPVERRGVELVDVELRRRQWPARAVRRRDAVHLEWALPSWPTVSIVIPSPCNRALLGPLFESLVATDYPAFDVVVVDNSGATDEKSTWYREWSGRLDLRVQWWDHEPFNFSAVNNVGAAATGGAVLVFLNDDCRCDDPAWLRELVGWATRPEIGTVGPQLLDAEGRIQHGGVIMGINGLAEHLFRGTEPHRRTLIGSTDWIRDVSAVTGACVALRRELFDEIGGFDEAFRLIGSDVALSLEARRRGLRTVVTPAHPIRHLESATRGAYRIDDDAFRCWWSYQRWIIGGDPYWSPNLSMVSNEPRVVSPVDPGSLDLLATHLGRSFGTFRQEVSEAESFRLAGRCRADDAVAAAVRALHLEHADPMEVATVNWFLPDFDSPFYGGINTALRIAAHLRRDHGVTNRFVMICGANERFFRTAIESAYPELAPAELHFISGAADGTLAALPPADVAVATIWHSAYAVAHAVGVKRKAYLIQDFEPCFHPAGTQYALAEESYRLGLLGICNTPTMMRMYQNDYGGNALSFTPAVDTSIFHADGRPERREGDPLTVFLYARPGHWRNCWELAEPALRELKRMHGDGLRIVTAGSWARPDDLGTGIAHRGMVEYAATGALYRRADVGLALTVSRHPSYLPLELMACGVASVAFDLGAADDWLFRPGENILLAHQSVDGIVEQLDLLLRDAGLRRRIVEGGLATIAESHSSWDAALAGIHPALSGALR